MSLIDKIDAEIASLKKVIVSAVFSPEVYGTLMGKIQMAERIKEFVLSEQKEPCEYCTETSKIEMYIHDTVEGCKWCDKEKCDNYDDSCYGIGYGVVPQNFCPVCGRHLNQPYTE